MFGFNITSCLCGTPTPANWPEVINLPMFQKFKFKEQHRRKLKEELTGTIPEIPLDLLDRLLTLDPGKRLTANEALEHPFLAGIDRDNIPSLE